MRSLAHHPIPRPLFSRSYPHERRNMKSVWPKSGERRVLKSGNGGLWTRNTQGKLFGNTSTHLIYDTFGNLISGANPLLFGYTGKAFDTDTNLQNNINRWYDAAIGRWLSTDPIGFEGNDTNLYRYVRNIPNFLLDYHGLLEESLGKTIVSRPSINLKIYENIILISTETEFPKGNKNWEDFPCYRIDYKYVIVEEPYIDYSNSKLSLDIIDSIYSIRFKEEVNTYITNIEMLEYFDKNLCSSGECRNVQHVEGENLHSQLITQRLVFTMLDVDRRRYFLEVQVRYKAIMTYEGTVGECC